MSLVEDFPVGGAYWEWTVVKGLDHPRAWFGRFGRCDFAPGLFLL